MIKDGKDKEEQNMRCPRCNQLMKNAMHFEPGKQYAYHMCPKCKQQTHQKRIHFEMYVKGNLYEIKK